MKMLWLNTILLLFCTISSNKITSHEEDSHIFETCLDKIISNKGSQNTRSMIVVTTTFTNNSLIFDAPTFRTDAKYVGSLKHLVGYDVNFIIHFESLTILRKILQIIRTFMEYVKFNYFLILSEKNKDNITTINTEIWKSRVRNFVILQKVGNKIELYSLDFDAWNCGHKMTNRIIGNCEDQIINKNLIFPEKFHTYFIGCPFRVIWTIIPPWVISTGQNYPGVHVEIMNIFRIVSQFDLIYMPENSVYKEELQNNYTFDSLLRDFNSGYADVFVGLASYFGSIPVEKTFITDNKLYFAMPKPKQISYLNTFLLIFDWKFCLAMATIILLISLVMTGLSKISVGEQIFNSFPRNILNSYAISLGMSIKVSSNRNLRTLICFFSFCAIIQISTFQGKLYSFLSKPLYEKPIVNLKELLEANIPLKFIDGMRVLFDDINPENHELLKRGTPLANSSFLSDAYEAYHNNYVVIVDQGVMILNPNFKEVLQMFPIHSFIMCYYLPKNHVLYDYFDRTIRRIIESGFLDKIISEMKFHYTSTRDRFEKKKKSLQVSLKQMETAFVLLFFGYILAGCALTIECLSQNFTFFTNA